MRTDTLLAQAAERLAAVGVDTPRLDAEILLARAAGVSRSSLFTWPERGFPEAVLDVFRSWVERRVTYEPVAYILGDQEFYGRLFEVSPAVLIPRPETEHLIETVLELEPRPQRLVDVGTGSGCIALTLALEISALDVVALDISEQALDQARRNARKLGLDSSVRFAQSDLLSALVGEAPFDVVVSNPPYVEMTHLPEMQPDVARFEPHVALFAGDSGLDVIRRLCDEAHALLKPGGHLVMEFGAGQHEAIGTLLLERSYTNVTWVRDLAGYVRVVSACKALP
ncbi:MAG: peptide chain release factor N(5)-glutamine methyltransferase [Myxococcota bacterium]|nr:peptide chain release factor N(5)-glutamine methyltransferase [Myxococcota bacterium]